MGKGSVIDSAILAWRRGISSIRISSHSRRLAVVANRPRLRIIIPSAVGSRGPPPWPSPGLPEEGIKRKRFMQRRKFGNSSLEVSAISLGCWIFGVDWWGHYTDEHAMKFM